MRALIWKDLYNIWVGGAILMGAAWYGWLSYSDMPLGAKIPMTVMVLVFMPLGKDDKHRTDALYCSLPVTRREIVIARYVSVLIMIGVVALVCVATHFVLHPEVFSGGMGAGTLKEVGAGMFFLAMFCSVLYPIYFKFGARMEEAKWTLLITVIMIFLILGGIVMGLTVMNVKLSEIKHINLYRIILIPSVLGLSVFLSLMFYKKREF